MDVGFSVVSARSEPHSVAPTIVFRVRMSEASHAVVHTAILNCLLRVDPRRRRYSAGEAGRLGELFGERSRWNDTMRPLLWTETPIVVPHFEDRIDVEVPIPCTYDFEVASAKYFHGLDGGEIPLVFLFSGTVFVGVPGGYQALPVPWDQEAAFRLPAETWREAMAQHFHDSAWIRLRRQTFDALYRIKTRRALPTWDETVDALCAETEKPASV